MLVPAPIHVTLYRGAYAPVPISRDDFDTWDEWADSLEDLVSRESGAEPGADIEDQKRSLLAWAPHRLRDTCANGADCDECGGEVHRLAANVVSLTLLVIDVDIVADANALVAAARKESEHGLVYESPSSTTDAPRVRVVVPVSRPITPDECRASRLAFAELLGLEPGSGPEGAIDAAKLFFAGRLHGTPKRKVWRW